MSLRNRNIEKLEELDYLELFRLNFRFEERHNNLINAFDGLVNDSLAVMLVGG